MLYGDPRCRRHSEAALNVATYDGFDSRLSTLLS